jgi:exopolyphosphatase/pppGpp-phosphohydrolase
MSPRVLHCCPHTNPYSRTLPVAAAHRISILRAPLLPGGAAIIAVLRVTTGADELVLTAAGLRDGILIEFFETRREKGPT